MKYVSGIAIVISGLLCMSCSSLMSLSSAAAATQDKSATRVLVDFSSDDSFEAWQVEDDVVMGGVSAGEFTVNDEGYGVFSGEVSLENNGGFSSVQYYFDRMVVGEYTTACIRLKGDGKRYQFRVESGKRERHSYIYHFETSGDWETIEIPLKEMVPQWRGRKLNLPNFSGETINHIRFLIANGKAESFELMIEKVWLR